jgi:hypothetical protein
MAWATMSVTDGTSGRGVNINPQEPPQAKNAYVSGMWKAHLTSPILLTDVRVLRTLADVRKLVLKLSETNRLAPHWQRLGEVLLSAAHTAGLLDPGTDQVKEALRRTPNGRLRLVEEDLKNKSPGPSVKRRPAKKAIRLK